MYKCVCVCVCVCVLQQYMVVTISFGKLVADQMWYNLNSVQWHGCLSATTYINLIVLMLICEHWFHAVFIRHLSGRCKTSGHR